MNRTSKLLTFILILAVTTLACTTITRSDNLGGTDGSEPVADQANILFEDDFSNPNSGWDTYTDTEGVTDYADGAYKIGVYAAKLFYWANPYKSYGDVSVEVQAQKISGGDDMQYGVVCRHQDVDNWYVLIISGDGYAAVRKRFQGGELEFITEWVQAPMVNTGNATNLFRAECVGNRLSLFVNGELAIEAFDSDINSGDIGLMAGTFETADSIEVLFDNFVVRKP